MASMKTKELLGKPIVSQDGHDVGEVAGLEIDVDTWKVLALDVKLERAVLETLHLEKPVFGTQTMRIPVDRVSGVSERVVLRVPLVNLAVVPDTPPPTETEEE